MRDAIRRIVKIFFQHRENTKQKHIVSSRSDDKKRVIEYSADSLGVESIRTEELQSERYAGIPITEQREI